MTAIDERPAASGSLGHLSSPAGWTFLTNHGHVLLCLAADGDLRVRDIADRVGITERATQRIIADLVDAGYLQRERVGRRNAYRLRLDRPMRHPLESIHVVGDLVLALAAADRDGRAADW